MGYYCTVPQCTSLAGKTKNVKFHRFPRDLSMADKWNMILKRGKPYTKYSKVCSLHFTQGDYNVTTMGQWKTLSKDAVPSQNLPKLNPDGTVMVIRKSRTLKYREGKKEEHSDKMDKWQVPVPHHGLPATPEGPACSEAHDTSLAYRLQTLNSLATTLTPTQTHVVPRPRKQDAVIQTDPIASEEDDSQPNNSYSEVSDKSYTSSEVEQYPAYPKETPNNMSNKNFEPKDYTKPSDDYIPQTNEEYNKEAEKYALERKSLNGYDKVPDSIYQKSGPLDNGYQKLDLYSNFDKGYQRPEYPYPVGYPDSAETLRNQQHNLQMLQEPHRVTENQNFFDESHIKQEVENNGEEDKYIYDRNKDPLEMHPYDSRRQLQQQRLLEQIQQQVKQEPDTVNGRDTVMQPQNSPYYPPVSHSNVAAGYYEPLPRPGPELLIAKQNALAAHSQLWQNTMKRPFFYSEGSHYNNGQLLQPRYEDIQRILQ